MAFSRDGKQIVSASRDGIVRLWDSETGQELRQFEVHQGHVWSVGVAFSPDGERIVSSGRDVRLWEAASGKQIQRLVFRGSQLDEVAFSPDGRFLVFRMLNGTCLVCKVADR